MQETRPMTELLADSASGNLEEGGEAGKIMKIPSSLDVKRLSVSPAYAGSYDGTAGRFSEWKS